MSRPRAVAWDVDGTLVDSEPLHLQALQAVCHAHGVDISDQGATPFIGVAIAQVWRILAPRFGQTLGRDPEGAERTFRAAVTRHYLDHAHQVRPMPGAREALAYLARQQVAMVAVSSSERPIVMANLRALASLDLFCGAICLEDVQHPKPAAEPFIRALAVLALTAADTWAVEDSLSGARSARAAGLQVLVVGGDLQAPCDHRMPDLLGFPPWWQSLDTQGHQDMREVTRLAARGVNE